MNPEEPRADETVRAEVDRLLADIDRRLTEADRVALKSDTLYDDAGLPY